MSASYLIRKLGKKYRVFDGIRAREFSKFSLAYSYVKIKLHKS